MTRHIGIVPLAEAVDLASYGGKATNLARLIAAGLTVPDGFVIGDRVFESDAIEIARFDSLLPGPVIVRSSAIGEDSAEASFAGQLESIAGVTTPDRLREAIDRVRASRFSDRVAAYQASKGTPLRGMAVIVQRQVNAAVSGVLFTVSPSDPAQMMLEYCGGLGEALVAGEVNPGRVAIERSTHRWSQVACPDEPAASEHLLLNDTQMAQIVALAFDIERTFGAPQDVEWTIDAAGKLWIVQSRPITHRSEGPSVPESESPRIAATEGPKDSRTHGPGVVWSNANVNENFPQPISPLLYSIARLGYYHYFRNLGKAFGISERRLRTMEPALRQIIGVHGARMYYNLTSIHSVLRSAPFGDRLAGSFNQFVGAEETSAEPLTTSYRFRQGVELAIIAAKTTWQYLFLTRRVGQFERTVDDYARDTHPARLRTKSTNELLADFRDFVDIRYNRWKNASLADTAAMVCYGAFQRLLSRAVPADDQQSLHNGLLKALPDLVSGIPALKLWDLSRLIRADVELRSIFESSTPADVLVAIRADARFRTFREAFDDFLENWGFRCSAELMLTVPSFQEEPEPVIELLKAYTALDGDSPADQLKQQESERLRATATVMKALGWRHRVVVRTVLRWTQRSIQLRERARLKQALLYSRLRRLSLALGERLVSAGRLEQVDDVFMLSAEELELLVAGGAMFPHHMRQLAALRRHAHAELSASAPPDYLELRAGDYLPAGPSSLPSESIDRSSLELSGVGACGGSTTARAAILLDVTETHKLGAGDVLVTRQTDPGWGPVFPLISGLVIERGGMLSHGAIIAREFGIPSVVGVKDATRLISHGSRVRVDGDRGVVELVDSDLRTQEPTDPGTKRAA